MPISKTLLLTLVYLLLSFVLRASNEHFIHLNMEDGLSINTISDINQDYLGFMWIGTSNGLNRYDGTNIKIYHHDSEIDSSLGSNYIYKIYEDSKNNLWIAHEMGISLYNRTTDSFKNFNIYNVATLKSNIITSILQINENTILFGTDAGLVNYNLKTREFVPLTHHYFSKNSNIKSLFLDSKNRVLIGTQSEGLEIYDLTNQHSKHYSTSSNPKLPDNNIISIQEDKNHNLLIGILEKGLCRLNEKEQKVTIYQEQINNPYSINGNSILDIVVGPSNEIIAGIENGGVSILKQNSKKFKKLVNNEFDKRSLSDNSVKCLFVDDKQNLWVGTFLKGISILPQKQSPFNHLTKVPSSQNSLSNSNVTSIIKDEKNRLWIGTDGGGLNIYDSSTKKYLHYKNDPRDKHSLSSDVIIEVYKDLQGTIWVGTYNHGLCQYNTANNNFYNFKSYPDDTLTLSDNTVSCIREDRNKNLWIGTWNGGINLMDRKKNTFKRINLLTDSKQNLSKSKINHIELGNNQDLWLATEKGIIHYDILNKKTEYFQHIKNDSTSLNYDAINTLCLIENILWIGTRGDGLTKFDTKTKKVIEVYKDYDLGSNIINGILPFSNQRLWVSTDAGLSEFRTLKKRFSNYKKGDGVLGSQFINGSAYIDNKKNMFFGSTEGLNFFHPDKIPYSHQSSKLLFTNFSVLNKSISYGKDQINKKHISISDEIRLPYGQSLFSFHFSYLNYTNPEKTSYLYKMRGFDDNWIPSHGYNFATYTNLSPDTYTFLVKALNETDKGSYTKPISIRLVITPLYYMTWWFRLLMIALFISTILLLFWLKVRLMRRKSEALQRTNLKLELEAIERKKTEELYKAEKTKAEKASDTKSQFLSTMSHEIRTPLNIIIGSLDLIEKEKGDIKSYLSAITISANNLLRIINNILDITKIEHGKLTFVNEQFSLREFSETIYSLFNTTIDKKGLTFDVQSNLENEFVIGDSFRINQMITNLIGNAIKFTSKGKISFHINTVSSSPNTTTIQFKVSDTGTGIAPDQLASIFNKFTQENNTISRNFGGTGLGLAIVKEMTNELNGDIKVDSKLGSGTTFKLTIEFIKSDKPKTKNISSITPESNLNEIRILTIDDNPFNLDLSKSILELHGGIVHESLSAIRGLELLEANTYDIIISDIHMPEMNGFELVTEMKRIGYDTPVIGCTADVFEETILKSKEVGMCNIITKPFKMNELIKKIHEAI